MGGPRHIKPCSRHTNPWPGYPNGHEPMIFIGQLVVAVRTPSDNQAKSSPMAKANESKYSVGDYFTIIVLIDSPDHLFPLYLSESIKKTIFKSTII